jgi:hypothetical protein
MNGGAMILMFGVGVIGLILSGFPEDNKPAWHVKAGIAWAVLWCGPPLARLWLAGVAG